MPEPAAAEVINAPASRLMFCAVTVTEPALPAPLLEALMVLASTVSAPARMSTLPAGALLAESWMPASSRLLAVIPTGANVVTVGAELLPASTGTSPVPATPVTWIVPPGAVRVAAFLIVTGPPTTPNVAPAAVTPSWLPSTVIAGGAAVRNPKAAGAAAVNVLPLGLVA